jgi:glutamate racemase
MKNQPIGFLDSGVGGLTVVKEVMKQLPHEMIYYIGDSARNPYGPRPLEEVKEFTHQLANFLLEKGIKLLVVACNTATVAALESLQKELPIPVIGVIESGSKAAKEHTKNHKIGVIGTFGTVQSKEYEKQILNEGQQTEVFSVACPRFVSIVEKNQFESTRAKNTVHEELAPFKETTIDTLVLGCTHYPLLQPIIQDFFGQYVHLIDPGVETAKTVKKYLTESDLLNQEVDIIPTHKLYTTGSATKFEKIASNWLDKSNFTIEHISIEELK